MRFLITGASGFIGTKLTAGLNRQGHEIGLLLRETSSPPRIPENATRVSVFRTQGTYADLLDIVAEWAPDIVIHLASLFISGHQSEDVAQLVTSNITFPAQLIEAMNTCDIKQLINTGTSWQHYGNKGYNPVNLYAATKQAAEAIFHFYRQCHEFKIITLKLFDTYGPGDSRNKLIPCLLNRLGKDEPLPLSPGEQKLDLVHIDDVCRAYGVAAELIQTTAPGTHTSYGISSGTHVSIKDLVKKIENISGRSVPVVWGGRPYRQREVFTPWTGYSPLPGWAPEIGIEEGLKRLILK